MIIQRFGDAYDLAQDLGTIKGEDDWEISRPPVIQQVGGMGGGFDYYGDNNYPVQSITVGKSMTVVSELIAGTPAWQLKRSGTGSIYTAADSGFAGVYDDIRPEVRGRDSLFSSEVAVGNQLRCTFGGTDYQALVSAIAGDGSLTIAHSADLPFIREFPGDDIVPFSIYELVTPYSRTYAGVETALDLLRRNTIGKGRSKLWALRRDGTKRWAWAKCTKFKPAESYRNKMAVPVEIAFSLPEGLWYSENNSTTTRTANGTFGITNGGDHPAMLRVSLNNLGAAITGVTLSNAANGYSWTFSGSLAWTNTLVVDSAEYSCLNGGTPAFVSIAASQIVWMRLEPGANTMTLSVTQSGTPNWTAVINWYDTWI